MTREHNFSNLTQTSRGIFARNLHDRVARNRSIGMRKVQNKPLIDTRNSTMRLIDIRLKRFGVPVIPPRHSRMIVQPLLDDHPLTIARYDEVVQVQLKAIL